MSFTKLAKKILQNNVNKKEIKRDIRKYDNLFNSKKINFYTCEDLNLLKLEFFEDNFKVDKIGELQMYTYEKKDKPINKVALAVKGNLTKDYFLNEGIDDLLSKEILEKVRYEKLNCKTKQFGFISKEYMGKLFEVSKCIINSDINCEVIDYDLFIKREGITNIERAFGDRTALINEVNMTNHSNILKDVKEIDEYNKKQIEIFEEYGGI